MNSDLKSQQFSTYSKKQQIKGFYNRLQEIAASTIYSENGGLPGQ